MRRVATMLTALALVASAASLSAQNPNFAGKWTLQVDPNAAAAGGGGGGGRGGGRGGGGGQFCGMECTVTQDAATLTVSRTTQAGEIKSTYKLDGTESKNTVTFGQNTIESSSTAKFEAGKLTITTKQDMNGTAVTSTTILSLANGDLVVERTAPGRDGAPATTKQTYKKS